jgi:hypothetical protein
VAGDRSAAGWSLETGAGRVRLAVAADDEVGGPAPVDFGVQTPFERARAENVENGGATPFDREPRHQTGQVVDAFDRVENRTRRGGAGGLRRNRLVGPRAPQARAGSPGSCEYRKRPVRRCRARRSGRPPARGWPVDRRRHAEPAIWPVRSSSFVCRQVASFIGVGSPAPGGAGRRRRRGDEATGLRGRIRRGIDGQYSRKSRGRVLTGAIRECMDRAAGRPAVRGVRPERL